MCVFPVKCQQVEKIVLQDQKFKMDVFVRVKIRNVVRSVKINHDDLKPNNIHNFFEKVFTVHELKEKEGTAIDFKLFDNLMTSIEFVDLEQIVLQYHSWGSFLVEIHLTEQCQTMVKITSEVSKV